MPKVYTALRKPSPSGALMAMPEASMDEHHLTSANESEIRPSGKVSPMQAEAITQAVRETPNAKFGACVLGLYTRHPLAALGGRERVHLVTLGKGEIEV
jgi:hypothetical protein